MVKAGYGSLEEVKRLDTIDIIQITEYESILADIQQLEYESQKES